MMARAYSPYYLITSILVPAIRASPVPSEAPSCPGFSKGQSGGWGMSAGKAIYMLTNDEQNAVAAIRINSEGSLGDGVLTFTAGAGSAAMTTDNKTSMPDALLSQSALVAAGSNIFAVNAGSNTISMLVIHPSDPCKLTLVGKPAALPGTFPNTVAASIQNSLVCVGMTGSKAGVSCANFDGNGIGAMDALRPFNIGQSDPPVGPLNTVSQVLFSEDESMLYAMVKGDPNANNTGFMASFPIAKSSAYGSAEKPSTLSTRGTSSSPNGTAVLFGSFNIPNTNPPQVFATDASFGAGILSVSSSGSATTLAKQAIDGQMATCWAALSPATNTAFVTDVAKNRLVEMDLKNASIISNTNLPTTDPGLIDLKAAGTFVYALSPGNGTTQASVSVVDVKSKALVQHKELGQIGIGARAQGMAIMV